MAFPNESSSIIFLSLPERCCRWARIFTLTFHFGVTFACRDLIISQNRGNNKNCSRESLLVLVKFSWEIFQKYYYSEKSIFMRLFWIEHIGQHYIEELRYQITLREKTFELWWIESVNATFWQIQFPRVCNFILEKRQCPFGVANWQQFFRQKDWHEFELLRHLSWTRLFIKLTTPENSDLVRIWDEWHYWVRSGSESIDRAWQRCRKHKQL